jgi:selenide,water dikinase
VRFEVEAEAVPLMEGAMEYAYRGILNGGIMRNRKHLDGAVDLGPRVNPDLAHVLFDPQTSGGLLVAVAPGDAGAFEVAFDAAGLGLWRIGHVTAGSSVGVV